MLEYFTREDCPAFLEYLAHRFKRHLASSLSFRYIGHNLILNLHLTVRPLIYCSLIVILFNARASIPHSFILIYDTVNFCLTIFFSRSLIAAGTPLVPVPMSLYRMGKKTLRVATNL